MGLRNPVWGNFAPLCCLWHDVMELSERDHTLIGERRSLIELLRLLLRQTHTACVYK